MKAFQSSGSDIDTILTDDHIRGSFNACTMALSACVE
jgi:hypothetical protein